RNGNSHGDNGATYPTNGNGHAHGKGHARVHGHSKAGGMTSPTPRRGAVVGRPGHSPGGAPRGSQPPGDFAPPMRRIWKGIWAVVAPRSRPERSGGTSTQAITESGWVVQHESPGRLRLQNERLHRRRELCQAVERELMSVMGIDNYRTSALT